MTRGTTRRSVRIPDVLWTEYQEACKVAGVNASETIRELIRDWIRANEMGEK